MPTVQQARAAVQQNDDRLLSQAGVHRVGVGTLPNGQPAVVVTVDNDTVAQQMPSQLNGLPVTTRIGEPTVQLQSLAQEREQASPVTRGTVGQPEPGSIDSQIPSREREYRPVPQGVSYGHFDITAGTSSFIMRDPATGDTFPSTANHIIARNNQASPGDACLQPGPADGGSNPASKVAELEDWVPIGDNATVDMAWAVATESHNGTLTDIPGGQPVGSPIYPSVGDEIVKTGRTTGLTCNTVSEIHASVDIGTPNIGTITMKDLIIVDSFGAGGDSGAPCIMRDSYRPVGYLIAGNSSSNTLCAATNMESESGLEIVTADSAPDRPALGKCPWNGFRGGLFVDMGSCTVADGNIPTGGQATVDVTVQNTFISDREVKIGFLADSRPADVTGWFLVPAETEKTVTVDIGGPDGWAGVDGNYDITAGIADERRAE